MNPLTITPEQAAEVRRQLDAERKRFLEEQNVSLRTMVQERDRLITRLHEKTARLEGVLKTYKIEVAP